MSRRFGSGEVLTGIWFDAIYAAQRSVGAGGIQPRGVRKRAVEIMKQWKKENKERTNRSSRSGGKNQRRRAARAAVVQLPWGDFLGIK